MIKRNKSFQDLTGQIFGNLLVIGLDENRNNIELNRKINGEIKQNKTYYLCKCNCGNPEILSVSSDNLKSKHTTSCGCYHKSQMSNLAMRCFKKYNTYDLTAEYGICYLNDTNLKVTFDLEDYPLIKNILWNTDECGYARGYDTKSKRLVRMHKLITNTDENVLIDHSNQNKLDNRKTNLRYATKSENRINSKLRTNNTSGVQGVGFERGKWRARITINKKYIHLGIFDKFEDAVIARLKAEKEYFGEFAPQRHLFEIYNI